MDTLIDTEFGVMKQLLKNPAAASSAGQASLQESLGVRFFYQRNATINAAHVFYRQTQALLRKSPAALAQESAADGAVLESMKLRDYVENPVGKMLLRVGVPSFVSYALRLHDLDALNRLLGLGAEIIAADVEMEGIADFVAKSGTQFFDPYSGKPMAWDATSRQLSFKASEVMAKRKLFNLENGRVFLRM